MAEAHQRPGSGVSRRDFMKTVGTAALAASSPLILPSWAKADGPQVGPTPKAPAETAVARFYASLKEEQRKVLCFPFDDPKRSQVQNNWHIVKPTINDLTKEQQALCDEIFKSLCSDDGYERFQKQMEGDAGGIENYSVAVFGEPGTGKPFEWVLTGRHNTLRADGNSVEGAAFGGPIFYGHDATGSGNDDAKHTDNVWWYQGAQANAIFASLDDKQQAKALLEKGEPDAPRAIRLKGEGAEIPGLPVAELDGQQKKMVQKLLKDMTSPFRAFDVEEVQECLKEAGGVDKLRLTYYKEGDIGNDKVWDIWRLEGPAFAWYFHGSPHVHTWVNIARKAPQA
jgi:Protein of unknown function (DUF3500)